MSSCLKACLCDRSPDPVSDPGGHEFVIGNFTWVIKWFFELRFGVKPWGELEYVSPHDISC